jgi:plasmid stability protein
MSQQHYNNMKTQNHKYSVNLPDKLFRSLKIKAAHEGKSMKEIILFCIKETLGDISLKDEEIKNNSAFIASSNKAFEDEWNSKEDEKSFKHLQKYIK